MRQRPVPAPPRPEHASYSAPPDHHGAAVVGLICAIAWPLGFFATLLWNRAAHFAPMPNWLLTLIGLGGTTLPAATVMFAVVGLVRAFTQPQLRGSRWQAIVGLIFGIMWVGGYFLLA
jgi:hypothetical protein